jgi:quercetin dioxygenase-like cupin family protein
MPMARDAATLHVNPSDETIQIGPLTVRFLLTGEDSAGSIAAFEVVVPGAQRLRAPAHSHIHFEETIYGIAGVLTWTVDGNEIEVAAGQALCIPRGAVHRFDNNTARDARVLCVATPAAIGPQFFRECSEVINAAGDGPPDRLKIAEVMQRFGLTPVAPPG